MHVCGVVLRAGKVHGSLARAGKVRGQTPKVPKQEKKKKPTGRAMKRIKYNRRFVNVGECKERGLAWKQLRAQSGVHGFACSSRAHAPSVIESRTRCLRLYFSSAVPPGAALFCAQLLASARRAPTSRACKQRDSPHL